MENVPRLIDYREGKVFRSVLKALREAGLHSKSSDCLSSRLRSAATSVSIGHDGIIARNGGNGAADLYARPVSNCRAGNRQPACSGCWGDGRGG